MVAPTNLVIELGRLLYLLLAGKFLASVSTIIALATFAGLFISTRPQKEMRQKVLSDAPETSAYQRVS